MKNAIRKHAHRVGTLVAMASTLVVSSALMVVEANAAVDAAVGTALTALQADAASLLALVFPVILAIFAMLAGIKLFKRFGSKI